MLECITNYVFGAVNDVIIRAMLEPDSLYDLQFASDPCISSDGKLVAYVVTRFEDEKPNQPKKVYRSSIHLSRDGKKARAFTSGTGRDSSPRFSRDGASLSFLSSRDGDKPQLYVMPTDGGEARQLTFLKSGVLSATSPQFSSDGKRIAFLSRGDWTDTGTEDGTPRAFERIDYKLNGIPGPGFKPDEPAQVWLLDLGTHESRALTKSITGVTMFDWLPDGSGLIFAASIDTAQEARQGVEFWHQPIDEKKPVRLTDWDGTINSFAVSPDGSRVAVVGSPTAFTKPSDPHLFIAKLKRSKGYAKLERLDITLDWYAGNQVNSDAHFGAYPCGPAWVSNDEILQGYVHEGCGTILNVNLEGQAKIVQYDEHANIPTFAASLSGHVAFLCETTAAPLTAHVMTPKSKIKDLSSTTHLENTVPDGLQHENLEYLTLRRDGFVIEGWVMKPHGWKKNKKYPVVLEIHGGPATAWGHGYMHEFQLLASRGFAVVFCNIRGSIGYGEAHTQGTNGAYGAGDYEDLMSFLDACLEKYPWLDKSRQGVLGGSYGGVMTNWIISHTDRFKAAVTDRSICNWLSFYGTSDIGYWFVTRELRGTVPADLEHLWEVSPLKHVQHVKTPCLVIHSEEDHRCPIEQGEQWFTALQGLKVPSRFVRFPGESHELSRAGRPDRRVVRLKETVTWLERYLK